VLAAALLLGAIGLWVAASRSPDVALVSAGEAPWIWTSIPVQTGSRWILPEQPAPEARFERRFPGPQTKGPVLLHLRALRDVFVRANGRNVPLRDRDPRRWKDATEVDLTPYLVPGENLLQLEVRNPAGVALLQARLEGLDEPLETDGRWLAGLPGAPLVAAEIADDVTRLPEAASLPTPLASLRAHALALTLFGVAGAALFLALRGRSGRAAPTVAIACVVACWVWLFAAKIVRLPSESGFDAPGHVAYIEQIATQRRLPFPSEGLLAYHPPLYHATAAALVTLVAPAPGGTLQRALLSLLPALSGLGLAFVAAALVRMLHPGRPWLVAGAAVTAGFLPMNLTLSAGVSNEAPHALLASLALLVAVRALLAPAPSRRDDLLLGLALGAALLTKYTSAMLVPLLVGGVAVGRWLGGRASARASLAGALRSLALVAAIAGWLYARNLLYYRDPFVSSLNAWPGRSLWQYPGFHTPAYFTHFGDALTHPWYAGFHGFWDALYTTLWGDGMLSGVSAPVHAHALWRYDWMAAGFALALPATLAISAGWLRVVREAWRGDDVGRRVALSLLALLPLVFLVALLSVNLRYPFWSFAKAFYALFLTPALALFGVLGFEALDRVLARGRLRALRPLPWAWAAAFLGTIALAYGS